MPVTRLTAENKKRARTGCLACRQRRRKCDERKPQCASCVTRQVDCRYPADSSERPKSYKSITFIRDESVPGRSVCRDTDDAQLQAAAVSRQVTASSASSTNQEIPELPIRRIQKDLNRWDDYFDTDGLPPDQLHVTLLRSFQYRTAPWIEAGQANTTLTVNLLRLADEQPLLQHLICKIAANQSRSMLGASSQRGVLDASDGADAENIGKLVSELRLVGEALNAIAKFWLSSPLEWRQLPFEYLSMVSESRASLSALREPDRSLCKLQSRIDLAASILTATQPITSASMYLATELDMTNAEMYTTNDWPVYCLTTCLHFIHSLSSEPFQLPTQRASTQHLSPLADAGSQSDWVSIWTSCHSWYNERTPEMRPIMDVGTIEALSVDPNREASFPVQLYTHVAALQANAIYHIAALLLLENKPRLLNVPRLLGGHFASKQWHARMIAGLATSNSFAEQWDPILTASLLYIARGLTHPSQRAAVMACFRSITATVGIRLDDELSDLHAIWAS